MVQRGTTIARCPGASVEVFETHCLRPEGNTDGAAPCGLKNILFRLSPHGR